MKKFLLFIVFFALAECNLLMANSYAWVNSISQKETARKPFLEEKTVNLQISFLIKPDLITFSTYNQKQKINGKSIKINDRIVALKTFNHMPHEIFPGLFFSYKKGKLAEQVLNFNDGVAYPVSHPGWSHGPGKNIKKNVPGLLDYELMDRSFYILKNYQHTLFFNYACHLSPQVRDTLLQKNDSTHIEPFSMSREYAVNLTCIEGSFFNQNSMMNGASLLLKPFNNNHQYS